VGQSVGLIHDFILKCQQKLQFVADPLSASRAFRIGPGLTAKAQKTPKISLPMQDERPKRVWTILIAARLGEALGARWGEIDLADGLWEIPKERMPS
jgi:integrase